METAGMIIRTYKCDDCELEFEVDCESNDPDPDCPQCSKVLDWVPGMFAINGVKSKAIDYAQDIIEKDFGLSNLKDNTREGEPAYLEPPAPQTNEREKIERAVREYVQESTHPVAQVARSQTDGGAAHASFNWGTQPAGVTVPQVSMQHVLATAKTGPQGPNPMNLLHQGIKSGELKTPMKIVGRWRP
jgi:hypothetical protein